MSFQHTSVIINFDEHQETFVRLISEGYVGHHIWHLQNLKATTIIQVNYYDVLQVQVYLEPQITSVLTVSKEFTSL